MQFSPAFYDGAKYADIVMAESGPIIACRLAIAKGHLDRTRPVDFVRGFIWQLLQYASVTGEL